MFILKGDKVFPPLTAAIVVWVMMLAVAASTGNGLYLILFILLAGVFVFILSTLRCGLIALWRIVCGIVSCYFAATSKAFSSLGLLVFLVLRGRLTVRASTYLLAMSQPSATPELANRLAFSIDTYAARQRLPGAILHYKEVFNGSRLALISQARLQGFIG